MKYYSLDKLKDFQNINFVVKERNYGYMYWKEQRRQERIKNLLNKEVAIIKYQTEYSTGVMIMTKSHYVKKLKKIHKVFKDCITFECIKIFTEEDLKEYESVL